MNTNNSNNYMIDNDNYKGDAPNDGDMELIRKNAEEAMKIQRNFWKWKNNQENSGDLI